MSDLTKALLGYEETPFGYASESQGRDCPVALDEFIVDEQAGIAIIPTPNGGVMGAETEIISLKEWLGLGWGSVSLTVYQNDTRISVCRRAVMYRKSGSSFEKTTHKFNMPKENCIWAGVMGIVLPLAEFKAMIACFDEQDRLL